MMPIIRISDATFVDLKSVSTWLEAKTPSEAIEKLVQDKMHEFGLERDIEESAEQNSTNSGDLIFEKAPGLYHTKVISAFVGGSKIDNPKWVTVLIKTIAAVKAKGLVGEELAHELQIPARQFEYAGKGYKYHPNLGISFQGQSAPDAWKETNRLATKFRIPVEVRFQWYDKDKAQHPGRIGRISAGN